MNTPPNPAGKDDPAGIAYATAAYTVWGVMPLFWHLLGGIPPFETTVHRVLWCALLLGILIALRGEYGQVRTILRSRRLMGMLALSAVLIAINWTTFIYSITSNQLVEASLGYYITPLLSIVLGVALFGENMSPLRLVAICMAAIAVIVQIVALGHVPWIALTVAGSFGFYGYVRKLAPVPALHGLFVETGLMFPVMLALVVWWALSGTGAFPAAGWKVDLLLMTAGPLTALPLTLFAAGVRRIRLSTLGFLQYLAPSINLIMATVLFGEPFTSVDAITFGCVWSALLLVAVEGRFRRVPSTSAG